MKSNLGTVRQCIFYFLVYGLFHIKSGGGGRNKNKNKIEFYLHNIFMLSGKKQISNV